MAYVRSRAGHRFGGFIPRRSSENVGTCPLVHARRIENAIGFADPAFVTGRSRCPHAIAGNRTKCPSREISPSNTCSTSGNLLSWINTRLRPSRENCSCLAWYPSISSNTCHCPFEDPVALRGVLPPLRAAPPPHTSDVWRHRPIAIRTAFGRQQSYVFNPVRLLIAAATQYQVSVCALQEVEVLSHG